MSDMSDMSDIKICIFASLPFLNRKKQDKTMENGKKYTHCIQNVPNGSDMSDIK